MSRAPHRPEGEERVKLLAKLERARDEFGNFAFDEEGKALYVPFRHTVNVEVSRVSREAKEIIESLGGRVTRVHYNKLGFRALLKPHKFPDGLPRPARPPIGLRRQVDRAGTLPAPAPPGTRRRSTTSRRRRSGSQTRTSNQTGRSASRRGRLGRDGRTTATTRAAFSGFSDCYSSARDVIIDVVSTGQSV